MAIPSAHMLNLTCTIKRPLLEQVSGGTKSTFQDLLTSVTCAIQTMSPTAIADYMKRGIAVDTKVYTSTDVSAVKVGDIVVDSRYTPTRNYIVKTVEDMGGRGEVWGIFCLSKF